MRHISSVPTYFQKLLAFADTSGAFKLLMFVIGVAWEYVFKGQAEQQAAIGAGVLITVDAITGVLAAYKSGQPITSRGFANTLTKALSYISVLVVAAVCENTVLHSLNIPMVTPVLGVIIATEGLSILENVHRSGIKSFAWMQRILEGVQHQDDQKTPAKPGDGAKPV